MKRLESNPCRITASAGGNRNKQKNVEVRSKQQIKKIRRRVWKLKEYSIEVRFQERARELVNADAQIYEMLLKMDFKSS